MSFINSVCLSDNLEILKHIESETIDLIYIDPPFFSGKDYGEFSDIWETINDYLLYMLKRIEQMYRVLKSTGSLYCQCDESAKFELKPLFDRFFGRDNFRREIIWNNKSVSGFKSQVKGWVRQHDTLLYYIKSNKFTFNKQYRKDKPNVRLGSVWNDIYSYQTRSRLRENYGYPTQKPLEVLERIVLASSNEGDLVADFFCGSGTTLVACKKLHRRWLGVDNNKTAVDLSIKRLSLIHDVNKLI